MNMNDVKPETKALMKLSRAVSDLQAACMEQGLRLEFVGVVGPACELAINTLGSYVHVHSCPKKHEKPDWLKNAEVIDHV